MDKIHKAGTGKMHKALIKVVTKLLKQLGNRRPELQSSWTLMFLWCVYFCLWYMLTLTIEQPKINYKLENITAVHTLLCSENIENMSVLKCMWHCTILKKLKLLLCWIDREGLMMVELPIPNVPWSISRYIQGGP